MHSNPRMMPDAPPAEPDTKPGTPTTEPDTSPGRRTNPGQPDPSPMTPPAPSRETCPDKGPCPFTNTWGTRFLHVEGAEDLSGATIGG